VIGWRTCNLIFLVAFGSKARQLALMLSALQSSNWNQQPIKEQTMEE
jgi:hypothetical protein